LRRWHNTDSGHYRWGRFNRPDCGQRRVGSAIERGGFSGNAHHRFYLVHRTGERGTGHGDTRGNRHHRR
jgi:hypothetical protein